MSGRVIGSHVLAVLVGLAFLAAGASKLAGSEQMVSAFAAWGYPDGVRIAAGVTEVLGAIVLFVPPTRLIGAMLLVAVAWGAVGTHVAAGEWLQLVPPLGLGLLAVVAGWLGRSQG